MTERTHTGRRVLLLEQGFLKSRKGKPVHGVELFRLHLIEQMLARGVRVAAACERSWAPIIERRFGGALPEGLELIATPNLGGAVTNGLVAAARSVGGEHDALIFGDARRGMIPAMLIAGLADLAPRRLLFAHRRPIDAVLESTQVIDFDVLAVSEHVAAPFRGAVSGRVDVMYGLPNAGRFHPPTGSGGGPREDDGVTHFVLLGRLPNISKGQEKAIASFSLLPPRVRERCRLHLASFIKPTTIDVPGVEAHHWIPSDEIPAFLRQMDAMLALSSNETFSQAIVQGMLTELPVIATSLPVYVEKMDTGAGFVADDPPAIATRMEELAADRELRRRMGTEGRRVALERYVWDTDRFLDEVLFPEA